MLRETGLYKYYQEKDFKDGKDNEEHSRYANLGMLITNIKEFEASPSAESEASDESAPESTADENSLEPKNQDPLLTYLSNITLVSTGELNEEGGTSNVADAVNLMTMHASKGLEFKYVFLVGFEKDILPSRLSAYSDKSLAEERRLAYVGVTRAKKALFISYAQVRSMFGKSEPTGASSFLRDLVREYKGKQDVPLMIEAVKGYSFY
jgi:DNA helicase-2/ATP-dependent DNA helicase PcrA